MKRFYTTTLVAIIRNAMLGLGVAGFLLISVPLSVFAQSGGFPALTLQAMDQYPSDTPGKYQRDIQMTPVYPPTTPFSVNLDIFNSNDTTTPLSTVLVTIPAGPGATTQLVDNLAPGSYAVAAYAGST